MKPRRFEQHRSKSSMMCNRFSDFNVKSDKGKTPLIVLRCADNRQLFEGTGKGNGKAMKYAIYEGNIDRLQQEVQSANDMLNTLNTTQARISQTAQGMDILPDAAVQDMNTMQQRLSAIQQRIQQIENNPVNVGADNANAELEQLRMQLNQAIQEQNSLNQAMQNMDVSAANDAYLRLSQTVSNTERYIRDNVDEQGRFNQEVSAGTQQANELTNTIKRAVAAYVSIQTVGKALNISDELVQTTSRLNMMNDGVQTTAELVNMVYAAAQDKSLGKGFCIGHSYFCNADDCTEEWMKDVVDFEILPMLSEYWFDESSKLQRWENILHGVFQ